MNVNRFEQAFDLASCLASEVNVVVLQAYLRDLKASHDTLMEAGKMYMERIAVDVESNHELDALYAMNAALKAAEALR